MINKKELSFTLVNDGNTLDFAPFKQFICPYAKRTRYQLDFYRDFVAFRDSPRTFILDNTGQVLKN